MFVGYHLLLDRILLNLLNNAVKFTKVGSVSIRASQLKKHDHHATIQIVVEDTGVGIPEDKYEEIFKKFSRLVPSYKGTHKGHGIGLYSVKQYLKKMDGTIDVQSELDKGTKFTVAIPLTTVDSISHTKKDGKKGVMEDQTIKKVIPSSPREMPSMEKKNKLDHLANIRLLIVEDNLLAAMAVRNLLSSLGCITELAKSGVEAVQMAKNDDYDLILMDIGLPDISGVEVAEQIRLSNHPKRSKVPIIALTGHGNDPAVRQKALDIGMQDVLTKPANFDSLQMALEKHITIPSNEAEDSGEPAPSSGESIIDWDACVKQCNGDDLTKEMLNILADDLKQTKETLAKGYANQDEKGLRAELHRVRGGVSYLTLPELEGALKAFHEAVKEKPQDNAKLDKTYKAVNDAIDHFWDAWEKCPFK